MLYPARWRVHLRPSRAKRFRSAFNRDAGRKATERLRALRTRRTDPFTQNFFGGKQDTRISPVSGDRLGLSTEERMLDLIVLAVGLGMFRTVASLCRRLRTAVRLCRSTISSEASSPCSCSAISSMRWPDPSASRRISRLVPAFKGAIHDSHRLGADRALLRNHRRPDQTARRIHDTGVHGRTHLPGRGSSPDRNRLLPRRRRRSARRAALAHVRRRHAGVQRRAGFCCCSRCSGCRTCCRSTRRGLRAVRPISPSTPPSASSPTRTGRATAARAR